MPSSHPRAMVFRVDAGAGVGLGHLQRSLALGEALKQRGMSSIFVVPTSGVDRVRRAGFEIVETAEGGLAPGEDVRALLETVTAHEARGVVVDSYRTGAGYFAALKAAGTFVVALDDLAAFPLAADVVINSAIFAPRLPYRAALAQTRFLLGPDYALLNPAFWTIAPRAFSDSVRRVLVMLGGSDPERRLVPLLEWVDALEQPFEISVVIGPFFENREDLQGRIARCRHSAAAVEAPDDLLQPMMAADVAVSGAGQTLYELSRVGTPSVAIQIADNQAENLAGFAAAGVAIAVGRIDSPDAELRVKTALSSLCHDAPLRLRMRDAGLHMVDGSGAARVAAVLCDAA